ncbi:hypothetical protein GCM10022403_034090 [Streptomyces coacervatus]|uniref:HEAT repeat domain-containing protein n=1 Tax=Streptomyces coacervatus TaxID=647381 RepID=A0ABP7HK35_9ACTN
MIRALDDDEESVWHLAGLALAGGWPGNAEVRNAMLRVFNTDRDSQMHLGRCLAKGWPGDPDVRDLLLKLARHDDERTRFSAVATMAGAMLRICGSASGWHAKGVPSRVID